MSMSMILACEVPIKFVSMYPDGMHQVCCQQVYVLLGWYAAGSRYATASHYAWWPHAPLPEVLLPFNSEFFPRTRCFLTWWNLYDGIGGVGECILILLDHLLQVPPYRHPRVCNLPQELLISLWMAGLHQWAPNAEAIPNLRLCL